MQIYTATGYNSRFYVSAMVASPSEEKAASLFATFFHEAAKQDILACTFAAAEAHYEWTMQAKDPDEEEEAAASANQAGRLDQYALAVEMALATPGVIVLLDTDEKDPNTPNVTLPPGLESQPAKNPAQ